MTKENLIKHYKHFKKLAEGDFKEQDFYKELGGGGRSSIGEMSSERIALIRSKAERHLKALLKKHPDIETASASTKKEKK